MPLARNVRRHFHAVGEPHARDLAERRVRLLRGRGVDAGADAALLRALLEGRRRALGAHLLAATADELIDRRHERTDLGERAILWIRGALSSLDRLRAP